jgi:uncharacterized protein YjbJ (UPF0337 family)
MVFKVFGIRQEAAGRMREVRQEPNLQVYLPNLVEVAPSEVRMQDPAFAKPARLSSESSGIDKIFYKLPKEEVTVPSRSSRDDKNEGAMDRAKGRMKEAGGALAGDKTKKSEGRSDQRKGKAKEKKGNLKDLLS